MTIEEGIKELIQISKIIDLGTNTQNLKKMASISIVGFGKLGSTMIALFSEKGIKLYVTI